MNNNRPPHIEIIVDRSGSMNRMKEQAERGLRGFLAAQSEMPGTTVSLHQFNDTYETVYDTVPLCEVPDFTLVPYGNTALLTATGQTITGLRARLRATPKAWRPGGIFIAIVTDGKNNVAGDYTLDDIQRLITKRREKGWEFAYLGVGLDVFDVAGAMGIRPETVLQYDGAAAEQSMTSLGAMAARGAQSGNWGFTDDERRTAL